MLKIDVGYWRTRDGRKVEIFFVRDDRAYGCVGSYPTNPNAWNVKGGGICLGELQRTHGSHRPLVRAGVGDGRYLALDGHQMSANKYQEEVDEGWCYVFLECMDHENMNSGRKYDSSPLWSAVTCKHCLDKKYKEDDKHEMVGK
jgi:hypothetical protein